MMMYFVCKHYGYQLRDAWKNQVCMLNLKLTGHYRYYRVSFNGRMLSNYKQQVRELLFKVLNRRSDRKSYTREGFIEMLKYYPLAMPKIYVSLFWDSEYYYEEPYAEKPHVRFCEGLTLWGVSLLDCRWISWTFPTFQGCPSLIQWIVMYFPLFCKRQILRPLIN